MARDEDLRLQALEGVTHWSLAVIVQAERVADHQEKIAADQEIPAHYGRDQRLPFIRLRNDRTLLFFCAANLIRAHSYLTDLTAPDALPEPPGSVSERAKLLRDCAEHWDEKYPERARSPHSGRAFRDFAVQFPGEDTDSHRWGPTGTTVGGLEVTALTEWAQDLYDIALDLEQRDFAYRGWSPPAPDVPLGP